MRQIKPLIGSMMVSFTDAYMRHSASCVNNFISTSIPLSIHTVLIRCSALTVSCSEGVNRSVHLTCFQRVFLCLQKLFDPHGINRVKEKPFISITLGTLWPKQNRIHSSDDILKSIFFNDDEIWISIKISLNFVTNGPIDNTSALVQIMAWSWAGAKPSSEPMLD